MDIRSGLVALAVLAAAAPTLAQETPKQGGMLTYMIPADAPPSLDGHRETTYATVHTAAPFYSTLIRINPREATGPGNTVALAGSALPVLEELAALL